MAGLTLDSGALIAFERSERRMMAHLKEAERRGAELTVPTAVIVEVWRGGARSARVAALLGSSVVEPLSEEVARRAGEAIGTVKGASVVDAVVMCSAAQRGDRVLTSDFDDLDRLRAHVPGVRIVRL
ncbi:MAG TPA: PIN domain-containing protein [Polyangiaceae bacterium]